MADTPKPSRSSRALEFAALFAVAYLLSTVVVRYVFPQKAPEEGKGTLTVTLTDPTVREGHHPILSVTNATSTGVTFVDRCPEPPVDVFRVTETATGDVLLPIVARETVLPCLSAITIPPHEQATIDLGPWKYSVFGERGAYEIRLPLKGTQAPVSTRVVIHEPGAVVKAFRTFITKPFLNFLIFVASVLPGHDLGVAIIVLTLAVKFLLFLPTQRALEGQRKMQMLQPKLEALKKQYAGDAQRIHEETVKLWKAEKVNPFQSCLPMVLQFPVLIGLFFVVRDGSILALSRHLIYPFYQNLPWQFDPQFLGLDLLQPSVVVFPALLAIAQFLQMKLSLHAAKRKAAATGKIVSGSDPQELQQKIMLYALPAMVAFFAIKVPAAVSLYWGVSTLFAIGQQLIVNREHLRLHA